MLSGAILAAACGAGALGAADPQPVTFAVVRGDGILIPFATKTGHRWRNTWPVPVKRVDVPVRLGDLPARWWGRTEPTGAWHAWFVDGTRTIATVLRPAWYPTHCLRGIGLQSNVRAKPPLPPPDLSPYPKLGLAATAPIAFAQVEALDERAALWRPLLAALAKPFADNEARLHLQQATEDTRAPGVDSPPRLAMRARRPPRAKPGAVRIERLYRMPLGADRFLHYFEAARRYPEPAGASAGDPRAAPPCDGLTFGSGWFVSDGTAVPDRLSVDVTLAACDYYGARVMLPLGYVVEGDTAFWFAQVEQYEGESYVVLRATAGEPDVDVVVATAGGRCTQ
jgi:hypothetical protein